MKKTILLITLLLSVVLAAGVAAIYFSVGRPLYRPGDVRDLVNLRSPLAPPQQDAGVSWWRVADDIRLFYETQGQGQPVLVIHGGPGVPYSRPWRGLEELASKYKFYYFHQRGCGRSTRPFSRFESGSFYANMLELEQTLGLGAQIADIERIRRILGQEKLVLIGHSFGGFLAALYAAEFPEQVGSLILVAPAGVLALPDESVDLFARILDKLPAERQDEFEHFKNKYLDFSSVFDQSEQSLSALNREFGKYALNAMGDSHGAVDEKDDETNGGWMVQAMYLSMGKSHDYRHALTNVTCPTLIMHGANDELTLPGTKQYVENLPQARFSILQSNGSTKAGHFIFESQPQQFHKVVHDFLEQNSKGNR